MDEQDFFHTFVYDDRLNRLLKANCTDIYSSYGLYSMLQMSCELEIPLNITHSNVFIHLSYRWLCSSWLVPFSFIF